MSSPEVNICHKDSHRKDPSSCLGLCLRRTILFVALAVLMSTGCSTTNAKIWPIVSVNSGGDSSLRERSFLSGFYRQSSEKNDPKDLSDELDPEDAILERSTKSVFWSLIRHSASKLKDGRSVGSTWIFPLFKSITKSEPSGQGEPLRVTRVNVLWFLLSINDDNLNYGRREWSFLWPLGRYFLGKKELPSGNEGIIRTLSFLPLLHVEHHWRLDAPISSFGRTKKKFHSASYYADNIKADYMHFYFLQPVFGYENVSLQGIKRVVLAGWLTGKDFNRTPVGMVAYQRGPGTNIEFSLLFEMIHLRRRGQLMSQSTKPHSQAAETWRASKWLFSGSPQKKISIGPIFYHKSNWEENHSHTSFLNGLWSYTRHGNIIDRKLLWFIRWRRRM